MIKAITFDLDGVYFINGKSNFIAALVKLGVSEDEAKRVFLKSDQMNRMYKEGKMTDEQFWSWAIAEWKLTMSVPEIIKLLIDGYEINEDVVKVLRKIRKNGYRTLVCSNNFRARIQGLDERFHFLSDFDTTVFAYEVGASKPSKIIFQELVNRSGIPAEQIVFADDNEDNLQGARDIGIQTFLYDGFDGFIKNLKDAGVWVD